MPKKFDPVTVVEAAYALTGDRSERLQQIGRALAPALPETSLLVSGVYEAPRDHVVYSEETLVDVGKPPPMAFEDLHKHQRSTIPSDVQIGNQSLAEQWARGTWLTSSMVRDWGEDNPVTRDFLTPLRPLGVRDCYAVVGRVTFDSGLFFCAHAGEVVELSGHNQRLLLRLALHIAAGERLHRYLAGGAASSASFSSEAVLSPQGKVLHAEGAARENGSLESLRQRVIDIEQSRGRRRREDNQGAVEAWKGLVDGRWSLVDAFDSDQKRFVVAHRNPSGLRSPQALTLRERQVADLILMGRSNGEIAYALGLDVSTISTHASNLGKKFRSSTRAALIQTLRAAQRTAEDEGYEALRVGVSSPRLELSEEEQASLSSAELEVLRHVVSGLNNKEIGERRRVSIHTVEKQVGSIYAKLRLSGREALVSRMSPATTHSKSVDDG